MLLVTNESGARFPSDIPFPEAIEAGGSCFGSEVDVWRGKSNVAHPTFSVEAAIGFFS